MVPRGPPACGHGPFGSVPSGLCHTDIHAANGDWPVKPTPPFIPGHEGVGIVERRGDGVTAVRVGDRVAIPWLGWACGECDYCITGWETLCERQKKTGYSIDGGWGEDALGYASYVGKVPKGIDPFETAPLICAGLTTYKRSRSRAPGRPISWPFSASVASATWPCSTPGSPVPRWSPSTWWTRSSRWPRTSARSYTVNAREQDPVEAIKALGGADAAIALAVSPKTFEQPYGSLRRGGTLVFVGLRAGLTKVELERRRLDDVNQAMHDVEHAAVKARVVFDLT